VAVEQLGAELRDRLLPSIRVRSQRLMNLLVQAERQARTGFGERWHAPDGGR
jgi:hypothetical protein